MDEFDQFDDAEGPEGGFEGAGFDDDGTDTPSFDDFEDGEVPGEDDLEAFAFDGGEDLEGDEPLEEGFAAEAGFDGPDDDGGEDEPGGDEAAYAATYEDLLLGEADNPPAFPPELDLDVPEPVDGYPWVDLDALGTAEAEPWVNAVDANEYALADIDDPAAQALARFWQG